MVKKLPAAADLFLIGLSQAQGKGLFTSQPPSLTLPMPSLRSACGPLSGPPRAHCSFIVFGWLYFLPHYREGGLGTVSIAWLPCFQSCRTLNRPTVMHFQGLKSGLWISTLHISFDSLMGRIIHSCFNLCFTYWWLWSSFPFLCLQRMLDLLGFKRSDVSFILRRGTLCHFHIDF